MDIISKSKVIVIFADIRGSSRWTRRMGDDEEARAIFMMAYEKEAQIYRKRTQADFYKRLSDGRMFVHHLEPGKESSIASKVVNESLGLIRRVDHLIFKLPSPRPNGFRLRLMAGMVIKEVYEDEEDWIGYVPNTCHKILSVIPEKACVAHESVKELIKPRDGKENGFVFTLLKGARHCPDGVDPEDVEALWTISQKRPQYDDH